MVAHAGHECCPGGLLMGGISMDSIPENVLADAGAGYWLWPRGAWASASTHCRGFLLAVLECGVWVLRGLYGLACCWVLRQQASFPGEWLLGFFLWGGSWWCSLG